jgi:hypothetical protein
MGVVLDSPLAEFASLLNEATPRMMLAMPAATIDPTTSQWLRVRFISWPKCGSHPGRRGIESRRGALRPELPSQSTANSGTVNYRRCIPVVD